MPKSKLEQLREKNKALKESQEIKQLEKENKHLTCVQDYIRTDGSPITVTKPTIATISKAEDMESDEERGKFLIEAICQLTQDEIEKLSYEDFAIHRDIVQSFFLEIPSRYAVVLLTTVLNFGYSDILQMDIEEIRPYITIAKELQNKE